MMDNEFNNNLIKLFCQENKIEVHSTIPHSHTGNFDVERIHLTLYEHIWILKNANKIDDTEELILKAINFYNSTIHATTKLKPIDFINKSNINLKEAEGISEENKRKEIHRENITLNLNKFNLFTKTPCANR